MKIDKVKNATTRETTEHYEVTLTIFTTDFNKESFDTEIATRIRKAIDGLTFHYWEKMESSG